MLHRDAQNILHTRVPLCFNKSKSACACIPGSLRNARLALWLRKCPTRFARAHLLSCGTIAKCVYRVLPQQKVMPSERRMLGFSSVRISPPPPPFLWRYYTPPVCQYTCDACLSSYMTYVPLHALCVARRSLCISADIEAPRDIWWSIQWVHLYVGCILWLPGMSDESDEPVANRFDVAAHG